MEAYDEFSGLSRRRYVAPNFAEARQAACATPDAAVCVCVPTPLLTPPRRRRCATC